MKSGSKSVNVTFLLHYRYAKQMFEANGLQRKKLISLKIQRKFLTCCTCKILGLCACASAGGYQNISLSGRPPWDGYVRHFVGHYTRLSHLSLKDRFFSRPPNFLLQAGSQLYNRLKRLIYYMHTSHSMIYLMTKDAKYQSFFGRNKITIK